MASIYDVLGDCSDLGESLSTVNDKEKRISLIKQHLKKLSGKSSFKVPEFDKEFEWLNVSEPLSLSNQLSGKIVVLDFFTYCCINCMHVLPDLHALEEQFSVKDGVVVLGVHSAKFENEKLTANILSAILRYDITHPVVNDSEATLWKKLEVVCWPTFVILGPKGQYLYNLVGEAHRDDLFEFVKIAVDYFKSESELKSHEVPISLEKLKLPTTPLRYPGKVELSHDELTISDTGNHRILISDFNGIVQTVIGSGEKGFQDGDYQVAMFSSPQGCCRLDDYIYIADTDNHAIRMVDLKSQKVTTIVGTGQMGNDKVGGATGVNQIISSPWDVCIGKSPGSTVDDVLYIAMAGTHQIWVYFLQDVTWYKAMKYSAGTCMRFAGSGVEENRNNSYPHKAGFAQPSGLALSNDCLYIADSESSSVRYINLKDGSVKGLVGGERDPTNLFAYGDVDGKGVEAKLQHPLGLIASQSTDQLYIADSYNHKIKCVDLKTKMCTTLLGRADVSDKGDTTHSSNILNEPGGLALDNNKHKLYIADTNNNSIKILDLKTMVVSQLPIIFPDVTDSVKPAGSVDIKEVNVDVHVKQSAITCQSSSTVTIDIHVTLSSQLQFNTEAPHSWKLLHSENIKNMILVNGTRGKLKPTSKQTISQLKLESLSSSEQDLEFLLQLFVCTNDSTCLMKRVLVTQPIISSSSNCDTNQIVLSVQL